MVPRCDDADKRGREWVTPIELHVEHDAVRVRYLRQVLRSSA